MCNNFLEKTLWFLKSNLLLNVETIPTILDNILFFSKNGKRKMRYIHCFETQTERSDQIIRKLVHKLVKFVTNLNLLSIQQINMSKVQTSGPHAFF